jgi:hypothetical protein
MYRFIALVSVALVTACEAKPAPRIVPLATGDAGGDANSDADVPPIVLSTLNSSPAITAMQLPYGEVDDYAPVDLNTGAGLSTAMIVRLMAADNEGSVVTGLVAGTPGDFHVICNQGGTIDGGQLVFRYENANSQPQNRFHTPDDSDFKLPKDSCAFINYDQSQRWIVLAPGGRAGRAIVQSLQLDFYITPDPITGMVNDWAPVDTYWQNFGYPPGMCPNGDSCAFKDNTIVRAQTNDPTGATLTGMQWLTNDDPAGLGPVKIIINYGPGPIVVTDQDPNSMFGNQFSLPQQRSWTIPYPGSATFWHGANDVYWQMIAATAATPDGTFPAVVTERLNLSPSVTPNPLVAGVNSDWNPGGDFVNASVVRATGAANSVLSGMSSVGVNVGDVKIVHNFGLPITVTCIDTSSQPQNEFYCPAGFTLAMWGSMTLRYDEDHFWFVVSHT